VSDTHNIDRIVERFKGGQIRLEAMSRGLLVLDENVQVLVGPLRAANIRVIVPRAGMDDSEIKTELLPGRILVTKNAKDFVYDASSYEYGIISLDKLRFIDPNPDPAKNKTVALISRALIDQELWHKRHGFILILSEKGSHKYRDLVI
jgi:hypothetical protein